MDWFIFSITATLLFGVQSFLYKSTNEKGANKYLVTLVFMITVAFLALINFIFSGGEISNVGITLFLGFLFATAFFLVTILQLKALEYLPTNKVFPITSSAANILVVIYAIFFFKEALGIYQIFGIFLVLLAVNLIHKDSKKSENYTIKKKGFIYVLLIIIPGAAMAILNKYAAISTDLNFFILVTYVFSIIISYSSHSVKNHKNNYNKGQSIKLGILIGIVNFVAYFCLLTAMKTGPLSLIAMIHTTFVIITVVLAKIIYKEEFTLKQMCFVMLSVIGIILLKF